jgi:hypothetical protein
MGNCKICLQKKSQQNVLTRKLGNVILQIPSKLGKRNTFNIGAILSKKGGALFMEKNEILKRSQTENILGDEREKQIRLESDTFSLIFMLAVILTTVNFVKGLSADGFLAIFWASILGRYCLFFYRHRKAYHGILALAAAVLCIANIVEYLGGI